MKMDLTRDNGKQKQNEGARLLPMLIPELVIEIPRPQYCRTAGKAKEVWQGQGQQSDYFVNWNNRSPSKLDYNQLSFPSKNQKSSALTVSSLVKNSSSVSTAGKGEREIVLEWISKKFEKMNLLGIHWQRNLASKKRLALSEAFQLMRSFNPKPKSFTASTDYKYVSSMGRNNWIYSRGCQKLQRMLERRLKNSLRQFFQKVHCLRRKVKSRFIYTSPQVKETDPRVRTNSRGSVGITTSSSVQKVVSGRYVGPNLKSKANEDYENQNRNGMKYRPNLPYRTNEYSLSPKVAVEQIIHFHSSNPQKIQQTSNQITRRFDQPAIQRPLSHRPCIMHEVRDNRQEMASNSFNVHSLSAKRRPVSAAPVMRMSCLTKVQEAVRTENNLLANGKNFRNNGQELPKSEVYRSDILPGQLIVNSQANQNAISESRNNFYVRSLQYLGRQQQFLPFQGVQRQSPVIENDYNLHGVVFERGRTFALPRFVVH